MYITEFFLDLDTPWTHDGSTRNQWIAPVRSAGRLPAHTAHSNHYCDILRHDSSSR